MKSIGLSSCILVAVLSLFVSQPVCAQASVPASGLAAFDTPSDEGQSITVEWESASSEMILLMRGPSPEGDFEVLREVPASDQTYTDRSVQNNVAYYYRLGYPSDAETLFTAATGPAVATGNWFRTGNEHADTHNTGVRHGSILHPGGQTGQGALYKEDRRPQRNG